MRELDLGSNNLRHLKRHAFSNLSLKWLYLHLNNLETIEDSTFENSKITNINLRNNSLTNLSKNVFKNADVSFIYIGNNDAFDKSTLKKVSNPSPSEIHSDELKLAQGGVMYLKHYKLAKNVFIDV